MREASPGAAPRKRADSGRKRRRWILGGLFAYLIAAGLILLLPVSYSGIVNAIATALEGVGIGGFGSGWVEFAANVLMFLPLGFLFTLLLRRHLWGVVLAIGLSVVAELVQVVIPSREPSLRDILANAVGAALGAALAWLTVLRTDGSRERTDRASGPA